LRNGQGRRKGRKEGEVFLKREETVNINILQITMQMLPIFKTYFMIY